MTNATGGPLLPGSKLPAEDVSQGFIPQFQLHEGSRPARKHLPCGRIHSCRVTRDGRKMVKRSSHQHIIPAGELRRTNITLHHTTRAHSLRCGRLNTLAFKKAPSVKKY
eukprot:1158976-Pelagomonas_calceolata.AAC.6